MKIRTITCFDDRTSDTFLIIASVSWMKKLSRTNNFVNVNVFNSITSSPVLRLSRKIETLQGKKN